MLDRFFTSPHVLERLRCGALSTALDDLADVLDDLGYSPLVAKSYLAIAGHFSNWLTLEGIAPIGLSLETVVRFRECHLPVCRCARPLGMRGHVRAVAPPDQPLRHDLPGPLATIGVRLLITSAPQPQGAIGELEVHSAQFLHSV